MDRDKSIRSRRVGDAELIPAPQPITRSLEIAIVIFMTSLLTSIIATGSVFPPHLATVYAPALVAGLAAVMYYAGARGIMIRPPVVP